MFSHILFVQLVFCNSSVLQDSGSPFNIFASVSNMSVDWVGYGYATLIASGGVVGYVKAGSVPSLAAGLLFGGLAGFGAYQTSNDPQNIWVSLATSGAMTGIMGKRFYGSRKFMPAGLMAGASLLMLGKLGLTLLQKPVES
ncbi:transmembrane protein 14C isoform X1 [Parambassis ranga]|uniref:Transmembrane protein 14C n=2 Tax=Parambassis ranga TaxID=210632 RepID=A0A6P7KIG1_9TELE|nr:transmembrane protein 14C-like isoform X1 [Parambassis ranga]